MPAVHYFGFTGDAYDATQTDENIHDGDVLVVESEGVVGFLCKAWPVAITKARGAFHTLDPEADITCLGKKEEKRFMTVIHPVDGEPYEHEEVYPADPGTDYTASIELARSLMAARGL